MYDQNLLVYMIIIRGVLVARVDPSCCNDLVFSSHKSIACVSLRKMIEPCAHFISAVPTDMHNDLMLIKK